MQVDLGSARVQAVMRILAVAVLMATPASAQRLTGTENGEWRYLGGDAGHTRSSPLNQINGDNFAELEVAWLWRGDNFGPNLDYFSRSTPIYVDGMLYTVATPRRQVVAIDPATGETLWTFREPETIRHQRSPRQAYWKVVAYADVNGRGVIYVTSPAFFPVCARCQDRSAAGELGHGGAAGRLPRHGRPRPDPAPRGGLGAVAGPTCELRRQLRDLERARHGHGIGAAHRGERGGRGARGSPAQLRPDPHRERPWRHHGIRTLPQERSSGSSM